MEIKNTDQIMRADIMVARIQDKNELANAGDIYVGTNIAPDVVDPSAGEDGKVAKPTVKNIQTAVREDANRQQGLRLGEGTSSSYSNIVELGIGAKAEANSACQIGVGTNNVANSLQFRDRTVVNGKGEIVGDYPLGFSARVMEHPGDNWPMGHADLQGGTLVTDWGFTETNGYKSEVAFVSILDEKADRANLNLVIDGNIYVDEGKRRVYAEGDKVGSAVNADNAGKLNTIVLTSVDDLINKNGSIKINGCVSFTTFDREVVLDSYHTIPVYSKGIIVGVETSDLAIIYISNAESGCLYYDATGKQWHWGIPNKATNADKTSFTNTTFKSSYPKAIILKESGTYQFYYEPLAFSCLLYYNINSLGRSSVFVSPGDIVVGGKTQISQNEKFYMQIGSNGDVNWFKENVKIDGLDGFYSVSSSWTEFNPLTLDKKVYYRKID